MRIPWCSTALLVLTVSSAPAATIRVPVDFPTIAGAFAAAGIGDTVKVDCGLYEESNLAIPRDVTLLGDSADSSCVVIRNVTPGVGILHRAFGGGINTIRWITFEGGQGSYGGAINDLYSDPRIMVSNCRFVNNVVSGTGGALHGVAHVEQCDFVGNRAGSGGAIFRALTVRDCRFVGNAAGYSGGAVVQATLVADCEFLGNRAGAIGGAVATQDCDVTSCRFQENVARDHGGGVYVGRNGLAAVRDCYFEADSASYGGGVFLDGGRTDLEECTFQGCHASFQGGGACLVSYMEEHYLYETWYPIGCSESRFLHNVAGVAGGGLAYLSGSFGTVQSCSFYANSAVSGGGFSSSGGSYGTPSLRSCAIAGSLSGGAIHTTGVPPVPECTVLFGNTGGDWPTDLLPHARVNGNVVADPLFCVPVTGDLNVSAASPLLPENNECGMRIGASGSICQVDGVVVTTFPPGVALEVDASPVTSPAAFDWAAGSFHTIGAFELFEPAPGIRYTFASWSDGGAATHGISAPSSGGVLRADTPKTYLLTTSADSNGTVTPETGWFPAQQLVSVQAHPAPLFAPAGWVGTGIGSFSSPQGGGFVIILRAPITEHARFRYDGTYAVAIVAQGGGAVSPASGEYHAGTALQIRADTPPRWVFDGWVGQGAGSYTGRDSTHSIQVNGPITETGLFREVGYAHVTMQMQGAGTVTPESGEYTKERIVTIDATPAPGYSFYRWGGEGPGSYSGFDRQAFIRPLGPVTQTAVFTNTGNFRLTMSGTPGGGFAPAGGTFPAGTGLAIMAAPTSGYRFVGWQGTGPGSYTGTHASAAVTMYGDVMQHAVFEPNGSYFGFELSVSASATNPTMWSAPPADGPRELYLWLTCANPGIAAFECGIQGTLPLQGFVPAAGVYDVGPGSDLLLAIDNCPSAPRLLGSWTALDFGGQVCLGPSASNGVFAAVDCGPLPSAWPDPVVRGFSSLTPAPCLTGVSGCEGPVAISLGSLVAVPENRQVALTWTTSDALDHAGFHVYRSDALNGAFERVTTDLLVSESPHRFVDTGVEADHDYYYKIGAVDLVGNEELYGPVAVRTPKWAPLVTALNGVVPNPFRGETEFRFSLARAGHARLVIYDVAGRVVRVLNDGELPAGDHRVAWDGRTGTGHAASGIYFARFEAGERHQTRRVVYLGSSR